ncbi:MAG: transketolase, partial [Clostridiales bacterium]|nr:transketolase [Clostridiales bacterium]
MNSTDQLTVNTLRILSAEAVQKANSGHPGLPMGAAPMAYALWAKHMKFNPRNPQWKGRDRFILSAGHGSALLYSLLHVFGYDMNLEDLKNFRQYGSKTPGHPEYGHTAGVEVTTGPLGQGIANGVGMALAESYMAEKFNLPGFNIVDNHTFVLCGDGCMMEGVASEAASLAGTLRLGKLVLLYDSNSITIEGNTNIAFREDVGKRFEAYGWQVIRVTDGNDCDAVSKALTEAVEEAGKPSLIIVTTEIGYGCPAKQGKASAHGEPLGQDNLAAAKQNLGWNYEEAFHVPVEVEALRKEMIIKGSEAEKSWELLMKRYGDENPGLAAEWEQWHESGLPESVFNDDFWSFSDKAVATRVSSSEVLNRVARVVPNLIGGSADLAPSTKTIMDGRGDYSPENHKGSNLHFGVREHAMGAIANGIALYGGLRAYASTFFIFTDYMKPAMRLSALMGLPVTYILTHDSIGVGEDG